MLSIRPTRILCRLFVVWFGLAWLLMPAFGQEWTAKTEVSWPEWESSELPADWISVTGITLDAHGPADRLPTLTRLARHGARSLPSIARDLDVPIGARIKVYLAESEAQFRSLQPGPTPLWADATAWPTLGIVFLKDPSIRGGQARPLEMVLDHELVHVLLGRAFLPYQPPAWIQEGVAQVYSGEAGPDVVRELGRGMLNADPHTLDELVAGFPSNPLEARLAYAQAADFFLWFRAEWGQAGVQQLIRHIAAGRSAHAAVRRVTGRSFQDVSRTWRARLIGGIPLWTGPLSEEVFWIFGACVLAIGGVLRRKNFSQRMEELEEEEIALDALVWAVLRSRASHQVTGSTVT